jgi:succinoglycan biosynthesis protein ExoM
VARPVIGVATYRRPELLAELLRSIGASVGQARPRIVVVDNDPAGSAAGVPPVAGYPHEYHHESTPGIAAARNRVLSLLEHGEDAVIFVDDDEVVDPSWYATLVDASRDADVVSGPVVARYGADLPRWIVRGRFFDRDRQASGSATRHPATNNVLVRVEALHGLQGRWFDESFSTTGGSDTELFDRMRRHGSRLVWCDDALVYEDVPSSRASGPWLWRRNVRLGNVTSRIRFAGTPRPLQVLIGAGRMVAGVALSLVDLVRRGHLTREHATHVPKGWGMVTAALGVHVEEYRR